MATVHDVGNAVRSSHPAAAVWAIAGLVSVLAAAPVSAAASDPVTEWNKIAAQKTLTASPALAPVQQTRAMAIVQVSVHDAVNGITGAFRTLSCARFAPAGASPEAAAIAAAHQALRTLFPGQAINLDTSYAVSLVAHGIWVDDPGLDYGRSVAAAILALRSTDGAAQAQFDYIVPNAGAPGVWERLGGVAALLPGWGDVAPWVLKPDHSSDPTPRRSSTRSGTRTTSTRFALSAVRPVRRGPMSRHRLRCSGVRRPPQSGTMS